MRINTIVALLCFATLTNYNASAQTAPARGNPSANDSTPNLATTMARYVDNASAALYYGVEHYGYPLSIQGTPYFGGSEWQAGTVMYDAVVYTNVQLKYDMVANELVVLHPNNYFGVTLQAEKVAWFTIGNHQFIYLPAKNAYDLKPGFYEQAVTGNMTLLIRQSKKVDEKILYNELKSSFVDNIDFYISRNNTATRISNEGSLMEQMGDKARKVREFMRNNEVSFRSSKDIFIRTAVAYYNQLP